MCVDISCLVTIYGRVFAKDGLRSHTRIADAFELDEDKCLKYEFLLEERTLRQDFDMDLMPFTAKQSHDGAAQAFFDKCAGTPERLIAYVQRRRGANWYAGRFVCPLLQPAARARLDTVSKRLSWTRYKLLDKDLGPVIKARNQAVAAYVDAGNSLGTRKAWRTFYTQSLRFTKLDDQRRAKDELQLIALWVKLFRVRRNRMPIWQTDTVQKPSAVKQ